MSTSDLKSRRRNQSVTTKKRAGAMNAIVAGFKKVQDMTSGGRNKVAPDDLLVSCEKQLIQLRDEILLVRTHFTKWADSMEVACDFASQLAGVVDQFYTGSQHDGRIELLKSFRKAQEEIASTAFTTIQQQISHEDGICAHLDEWLEAIKQIQSQIEDAQKARNAAESTRVRLESLKDQLNKKKTQSGNSIFASHASEQELSELDHKITETRKVQESLSKDYQDARSKVEKKTTRMMQDRFQHFDVIYVQILECQHDFYMQGSKQVKKYEKSIEYYRSQYPKGSNNPLFFRQTSNASNFSNHSNSVDSPSDLIPNGHNGHNKNIKNVDIADETENGHENEDKNDNSNNNMKANDKNVSVQYDANNDNNSKLEKSVSSHSHHESMLFDFGDFTNPNDNSSNKDDMNRRNNNNHNNNHNGNVVNHMDNMDHLTDTRNGNGNGNGNRNGNSNGNNNNEDQIPTLQDKQPSINSFFDNLTDPLPNTKSKSAPKPQLFSNNLMESASSSNNQATHDDNFFGAFIDASSNNNNNNSNSNNNSINIENNKSMNAMANKSKGGFKRQDTQTIDFWGNGDISKNGNGNGNGNGNRKKVNPNRIDGNDSTKMGKPHDLASQTQYIQPINRRPNDAASKSDTQLSDRQKQKASNIAKERYDQIQGIIQTEEKAREARQQAFEDHGPRLNAWEFDDKKQRRKITTLLITLPDVINDNVKHKWKPVKLPNLLNDPAIDRVYKKAIRLVHPDRSANRGDTDEQKAICERIFEALSAANAAHKKKGK